MSIITDRLSNPPEGLDDYVEYLQETFDSFAREDDLRQVFPLALRFVEEHPSADLGAPGPIVHFLERFYPDYVEDLCRSVQRKPTSYTVWMLNRVLNGQVGEALRARLLMVLEAAATCAAADQPAREQAKRFLALHRK